jgi:hypothetical protein
MPAAQAIPRWQIEKIRGTKKREPCMASKGFGLHQPPHPTPIGGGSSNRLAYREPACANRRASRLPARAAKKGGTNDKAAESLRRNLRLSSQRCSGTPIPARLFLACGGQCIAGKVWPRSEEPHASPQTYAEDGARQLALLRRQIHNIREIPERPRPKPATRPCAAAVTRSSGSQNPFPLARSLQPRSKMTENFLV